MNWMRDEIVVATCCCIVFFWAGLEIGWMTADPVPKVCPQVQGKVAVSTVTEADGAQYCSYVTTKGFGKRKERI